MRFGKVGIIEAILDVLELGRVETQSLTNVQAGVRGQNEIGDDAGARKQVEASRENEFLQGDRTGPRRLQKILHIAHDPNVAQTRFETLVEPLLVEEKSKSGGGHGGLCWHGHFY